MEQEIRRYLSQIGSRGEKKSRRTLNTDKAKEMVRIREAKRAYQRYFTQCFWSFDPKLKIKLEDIPWVADQLMKHGDRQAWELAKRLCP